LKRYIILKSNFKEYLNTKANRKLKKLLKREKNPENVIIADTSLKNVKTDG